MSIAKRTGLKRKVISSIVKTRKVIKALRTGLKRKTIRGGIKTYINPLNANKVKRFVYLKALEEKQRRNKQWEQTLKEANELLPLLEYEPVYSIKYPMEDISLLDASHYELSFVNKKIVMFERNSSFVNLFRRRMRRNGNGWTNVSVTIDAVIVDDKAPFGKQEKTRTYKPFEEKLPRRLSRRDKYQFLMFALLKDDRFNPQSGEHIISIGGVITKLKRIKMEDFRMGDTKLISALVDKCNNYKRITQNKGSCVQDYIYEAFRGEIGFKRYTKTSFTEEINKYVFDKDGKRPSTREIFDWRDNCHTNVSIYALDPFHNKFVSSPAPRNNGVTVRLCFICKDGHCFPILNEHLITKITKCSSLINHLDLIQWNSKQSEDKIEICKTTEDYYKIINQPKHNPDSCKLFSSSNNNIKQKKDYSN